MRNEITEFIALLEQRETWTVSQDCSLHDKCRKIATALLEQPHKASLVPFESWLIYLASLPYADCIIALARLDKAIGNATMLLVAPSTKTGHVGEARTIVIQRCNCIIRQSMQKMLYGSQERRLLIAKIAKEIEHDGSRD